jgi:hypothetical protein
MATGRPIKLTRARMEMIVTAVRLGCPAGLAAALGGICRRSFYNWRGRGARALEAESRGESIPPRERLFADFAFAVQRAEAEWEHQLLQEIAASDDWKAHAWLLERRFPDDYGRPGRVHHRHKLRAGRACFVPASEG